MTVPRWGIHQGIKYYPRRSILKVCPICKEFFLQVSKGKKKYCTDLCSVKARQDKMRDVNQRIIKNRNNDEHSDYMNRLYAKNRLSKDKWTVGTYTAPEPKLKKDGTADWNSYHQTLQKELHKFGLTSPH